MMYFAYGSNMSLQRIKYRLPNTRLLGVAVLPYFQLRFHKKGTDGSAKADALFTGRAEDQMFGALYQLSDSELCHLDRVEDCGVGYERKEVEVWAEDEKHSAWTYCALHIDRSLKPFDWYHQHVLRGAEQLGLPNSYIERIKSFSACADGDIIRVEREISIYRN
ncbi:MAG: gamma-glutamylcyclotransferase family protein [Neptuniibacter sp.]